MTKKATKKTDLAPVVVTFKYKFINGRNKVSWLKQARVFVYEEGKSPNTQALSYIHERSQWNDYKDFEIHQLTSGKKVKQIAIEAKLEAI